MFFRNFQKYVSLPQIIISTLQIFHASFIHWFFTIVWVTASLLRFLRIFLVFWQISTMLWSIWSRFFLCFPIPPIFFPGLCGSSQAQLQLIPPSPSWSRVVVFIFIFIFFFALWQGPYILSLPFIFTLFSAGTIKFTQCQIIFLVNYH